MFKPLTLEQCTVTVHAEQDWLPFQGAFESEDPDYAEGLEKEISQRLDRGDVWAWAEVTVTVSFEGLSGKNYMCGCSYKNEREFRADDYFDDMCKEALADLNTRAKALYDTLSMPEET